MKLTSTYLALAVLGAAAIGTGIFVSQGRAAEDPVKIPAPVVDEANAPAGTETIVLAGGCFWGVQAVFQHVDGVQSAVSGYAGGKVANPAYEDVSTGTTGHAESVEVKFDPKRVSLGHILQVYFSVAHNPTQLNYQGPDHGTQYRSAIFFTSEEQQKVAAAYIDQLNKAGVYPAPIVTEVTKFSNFYPAEDYHQDYAYLHPEQPYIAYNDLPKVANLKSFFPAIWRDKPTLVMAKAS